MMSTTQVSVSELCAHAADEILKVGNLPKAPPMARKMDFFGEEGDV